MEDIGLTYLAAGEGSQEICYELGVVKTHVSTDDGHHFISEYWLLSCSMT